jgi:hypothetical protein
MPNRVQMIDTLCAKLAARAVVSASLPLLSEGATYQMELTATETLTSATLRRIVYDTPLGRGFSFQLPGRRIFIYEQDLRPGPNGMLLAMVASPVIQPQPKRAARKAQFAVVRCIQAR